jgi:serine/threonine protein kinase/regulation of enolase protein 1 (concanavalin A-like superfamily)
MSKKSIFGLEPGQLDQLLSLGTDVEDQPKDPHLKPPMQAGREEAGVAPSVQEPSDADARAAGDVGPASRAGPEGVGDWIGPYKLLRILGEGGMGIVYLADQKGSICRQVALKIVKPGMDSKRVITRFEAEQKALAMMEHPHIARVYDAGLTLSGRPYFVMEYIKGVPITEYCDKCRLTIEERLHLFLHVCGAVQHAHQKGIIHRDLKPSNILVAVQDQEAVPKIIDFGVARAISEPLTERTLFTEQGQLIGTPEYMSPEQADVGNLDVDTRTDVYSLGVVLYVLLSGVLPFDPKTFREGGIERIRKIICEEEPCTPSTKLSKTSVEESSECAKRRQIDVRALQRKLHGDLDWITLKAMEKDRTKRYGTVEALATDVRNHLNHQPVTAAPPGVLYRASKFARRHPQGVTIASVAIALLFTLSWATHVYVQTDRERTHLQALKQERIVAEAQLLARLGPQAWETWVADLASDMPNVTVHDSAQGPQEHCRESILVCNRALEASPNTYAYHWMRTVSALWIGDAQASAYLQELDGVLGRTDMTADYCSGRAQQILTRPGLCERLLPLALTLASKAVAQQPSYAKDLAAMLYRLGQQEQAGRLLQMAGVAPLKGSCRYEQGSDTYTVVGCGGDIFGTTDEFHFVSKKLNGDGSIIAKIERVQDVHEWTKAGVMIRESLDPGARFAAAYVTPGAGVHCEARPIADREVVSDAHILATRPPQIALRAPVWVRIQREGDQFSGSYSSDGLNWTLMMQNAQTTISMPDSVYIGLAVTSHDRRKTAEARICHVTTTGNITPYGPFTQSQDISLQSLDSQDAVALKGSCRYEEGSDTYTILGCGVDIFGTTDEFHFASKRLKGNGSITAKINSVEDVHEWTKAGVMIRESLDPGASFAAVFATPGKGVRCLVRPTTNGVAISDTPVATREQVALQAPIWVKIERKDDQFSAFYSSDGETWNALVWYPQTVFMTDSAYIGLALTSHNNRKTAEARISHVSTTGDVSPSGPFTESQDISFQLPPTLGGTDNG